MPTRKGIREEAGGMRVVPREKKFLRGARGLFAKFYTSSRLARRERHRALKAATVPQGKRKKHPHPHTALIAKKRNESQRKTKRRYKKHIFSREWGRQRYGKEKSSR